MSYDQEKINTDLRENDNSTSEFQKKVVELCMSWVKVSADEMSKLYDNWDNNDFIYRGYRSVDKEDKDSIKAGEPPKIIVPITFAQTQTALSFLFATFMQKPRLYELLPSGPEDGKSQEALETDLDYQMTKQKALFKIYCYLLDVFKYGMGIIKVDWTEDHCKMRVGVQKPKFDLLASISRLFGRPSQPQMETVEEVQDILAYQGNRLSNVSPYAFYPDPTVTIAKFQDGRFVAHDEETSYADVEGKEGKEFFGCEKIPNTIPSEDMRQRNRRTGSAFKNQVGASAEVPGSNETNSNKPRTVVKLEITFVMSEKEATRQFGRDMGNNPDQVKWVAVIGNDRKLIQFKPTGYLHNKFNYALAEFSPDNNAFYNPGLSDTIYELQNLITFFLNSHVVNVKKIIQNRFIGDPSKVYKEDITNNESFIRLKQSGLPIDRVLQQLQVMDVTKQHVGDMDMLVKLVQVVTGINENALGQYSQGRRSATEARSVNAGAAARLKMHAQLIWLQGLEPAGQQILSNTRQGRTEDVYNKIVGLLAKDAPFATTILADPSSLAGGYDFTPYDATLPSDKAFQASIFQELLTTMLSNPASMQLLNKDPLKLLKHIAQLYGIKNIDDFNMVPDTALPPMQGAVQPDSQVGDQLADGSLEPVQGADDLLRSLAQ